MPTWTTMNDLATDDLVTEADMDAIRGNIEYLLDPNKAVVLRNNGGVYSTTSTSFVDVDGTNVKVTLTTNGGPVLILASGAYNGSTGAILGFDIDVDGARVGNGYTYGLLYVYADSNEYRLMSLPVLVTGLSAGSHTFKLQWKVNTATANLQASANAPVMLSAIEL